MRRRSRTPRGAVSLITDGAAANVARVIDWRGRARCGPDPAFDSAPYDAVPEPNEKFGRDTFGVFVSKRLEDSDELTTFSISFPNGAFFGAPSNAPNRNEGASRVAAPSRRGAESDERRRAAAGDGGPRVPVPVRARRRRGRVRLRDRPWVVTTRRVRVRGRSDVFRVFRV